jgi:hypothetical protein
MMFGPRTMRILILSFIACLVAACMRVPTLDEVEAAAVMHAGRDLLSKSGPEAIIPPEAWPAEIQNLKPESVRVRPEGLYIRTGSSFVEEVGLFVPSDPATFVPVPRSDPAYERVHDSLFSYYVAG